MQKKILITGANGQLGSELKDLALPDLYDYIFTDFDELDLTSEKHAIRFLEEKKPDFIVNCAAYTAVDKAETEADLAHLINAGIPETLAKYARSGKAKLIHISTDYVFAGTGDQVLSETDQTRPQSIYGKSKLAGEKAVLNYSEGLVIRTSWLYSSYGNNFVKSMLKLFQERDELRIVNDQIGSPTYAADLARLIMHIIENDIKFAGGLYHYSNEGSASWYEFAMEIKDLSQSKCKLTPIKTSEYPQAAKRPMYSVMSKEKIKAAYDIQIPSWKQSLEICLEKIKNGQ